jgi:hypothetical protein
MDNLDLDNIYKYHAPDLSQHAKYQRIRAFAKEFAKLIEVDCPTSRERGLAFIHLEQAVMWANASIAREKREDDEK